MLYGQECLLSLVECEMCQSKLKEAKILLCGHFCSNCVTQLTINVNETTREFQCKSCDEIHMVPKNGFKSWKALDKFYSKELNLEEIYRGESAEKLKGNLKQIQKQIDELDYSLTNSIDTVKEHCVNLRNEVDLEAEITMKRIQDIRDEMITEIDIYQANCISNLESDKIQKEGFSGFIDELRSFHKEWSEYLKKYQINDSEINTVNNLVLELNQRFKKEKVNLDKMIFNKKSMKFVKNNSKFEKSFLGNFDFKTIGAIDINQFKNVQFTDILTNLHGTFSPYLDFDLFEEDKIAVAYPDTSNYISISIIDKNREISKSTQTSLSFTDDNNTYFSLQLKTSKDLLAVYFSYYDYNYSSDRYFIASISSNLQIINSTSISYPVISLDVNKTNIYCLTNQSGYKIMIFNHQLSNVRNIGQNKYTQKPFYFSNAIIQTINKNNKLYCLNTTKLEIIDESTGTLLKSISIQGNKMAIDSNDNILVLSTSSSKIFKINLDGVLQDEIELQNTIQRLELSIVEGNQIGFLDKSSKTIYFE